MKHCVYCNDSFGDVYYTIVDENMKSNGENYVVFSDTEDEEAGQYGDVINVKEGEDHDKLFRQYICYEYADSQMQFTPIYQL